MVVIIIITMTIMLIIIITIIIIFIAGHIKTHNTQTQLEKDKVGNDTKIQSK